MGKTVWTGYKPAAYMASQYGLLWAGSLLRPGLNRTMYKAREAPASLKTVLALVSILWSSFLSEAKIILENI